MTADELTEADVGRYVELGADRPFARGRLLAVEHRPAGIVLTIEHTGHGHTFPVTAPARPDEPVVLA